MNIEKGNYSTISNLCNKYKNFYDLYELFNEIKKITLENNYYDKYNVSLFQNIFYLYYTGKYKKCKKIIKKNIKQKNLLLHHYSLLCHYELLCDLKLNNIDYKKVENILKEKYFKGGLVYSEESIKVLEENKKFKKLVEKYYSEEEINDSIKELEQVLSEKDLYTKINIDISKYMEDKDINLKKIDWNE